MKIHPLTCLFSMVTVTLFPFSFSSCLYSFPNMSIQDTSKLTMKESWNFRGSSKSSIDWRLLATTCSTEKGRKTFHTEHHQDSLTGWEE